MPTKPTLSWWEVGSQESPRSWSHLVTIHTCELSVSEAGMGTSPTISTRGFIKLYTRTSTYKDTQCLYLNASTAGLPRGRMRSQSWPERVLLGSRLSHRTRHLLASLSCRRQLVETSRFQNVEWNGFSLLKHLRTFKKLTCICDVSQMYD